MVEVENKKIKKLSDTITQDVNVGNDKRQFILRIPVEISRNAGLNNFKKKYKATFNLDIKDPKTIMVKLK